jgi:CubicO group peptidase (beta-lactamase class C family)
MPEIAQAPRDPLRQRCSVLYRSLGIYKGISYGIEGRLVKWARIGIGLALVAALAVLGYAKREYIEELPLGCAFKAKALCAGIFLQGLPEERLEAEDTGFDPAFSIIKAGIDYPGKRVTCSILGTGLFAKTAVLVEGLGPVLLSGVPESRLAELASEAAARSSSPAEPRAALRPWPEGDAEGDGPPLAESMALNAALDSAFAETDPKRLKRTRAVVVVHGGRIVAERYAEGVGKDTLLLSWSMAKSFTNAMVGVLVRQGRLDIRAPAMVPEWAKPGDPRRAITTDMLLRMSSGLSWYEEYARHPISDVNRMLFLEPDAAAYAARMPLSSPPDSAWSYSSGTANLVSRIVRDVVGSETGYLAFPYREIFDRIGMRSAVFGTDAAGVYVGSSYLYATARDYARFGLLCLRDGVWKGERILPERWMSYSTTPTPKAPKGEYGAFFWLNRGSAANPSDRRFPGMPADLFWAEGYQGQAIAVCPSLDLVVVRLGMTWRGDWGAATLLDGIRKAIGREKGGT